uniref:Uncharacterized protein n=1 Tax=Sipha flava TaxID=143950 RepID=A0A2S2QFT1_9HEMI
MITFIFQKLLPSGFIYKINYVESLGNDKLKTKFEIPDCSEKMFMNWLSELSQKSHVTYRVKSYTKSPSPKIIFNKVYRCEHNTFPNKYCDPHPKHTGCPSTLTVRITKCSEALSLKSTIADNNVMIFSLKVIATLYHCHNHILSESVKLSFTRKEKQINKNRIKLIKTLINEEETKNNVNIVHSNDFLSLNTSNSLEESMKNIKYNENMTEMIEETIVLYENENVELSKEFDNYIFVENLNTENLLHNGDNENELNQLLSDFDQANQRMLQQFESNPKYFVSAIKAYTCAMKNSLSSKESLLNALHSFGNLLHEGF